MLPIPAPTIRTAPSDDVLHLLASLSPQHTPTPEFLCPYSIPTHSPPSSSARRRRVRRASTSKSSTTAASYYPTNSYGVPPKYVQGDDGKWYTAEWTLHGRSSGQTTSSASTTTRLSPGDLLRPDLDSNSTLEGDPDGDGDLKDDGDDDDASYHNSPVVDAAKQYDDVLASLPTGWSPLPDRTKYYDIPMIIALSCIIAIVVTLVIAGCVLGHRSRRSKSQEGKKDVEKEAEVDPTVALEKQVTRAMKDARKKEKMWDRWRRNGQQKFAGLRKRRRREAAGREGELDPDQRTLTETGRERSLRRASFASSRTNVSISAAPPVNVNVLSRQSGRTSDVSQHSRPLSTTRLTAPPPLPSPLTSSQIPPDSIISLPPPSPTSPPAFPPAYRYRRSFHVPSSTIFDTQTKPTEIRIYIPSPNDESQEESPPSPSQDGGMTLDSNMLPIRGHVATDDKAVLERMRGAVSAPDGTEYSSVVEGPSVPVWEDERIEAFGSTSGNNIESTASTSISTQSFLPPPPAPLSLSPSTTSLLSSSSLLLPPRTHIDLVQRHLTESDVAEPYYVPMFPEPGPSAPPMMDDELRIAGPSAPPLVLDEEDEALVMASAPPLNFGGDEKQEDEEERYGGDDRDVEVGEDEDLRTGLGQRYDEELGMGQELDERRPRGRERPLPRRISELDQDADADEGDSDGQMRISTAGLPRYEP